MDLLIIVEDPLFGDRTEQLVKEYYLEKANQAAEREGLR